MERRARCRGRYDMAIACSEVSCDMLDKVI